MANVSYFSGNCEIIEIEEEELNPGEHYRSNNHLKPEARREEKDSRSLASNAGHISSLEDDLNQLFEIFNRRVSSQGPSPPNQAAASKKNAKKKAKASESYSPGRGISERVNLKQALRGLCLSQASEMAAMKRSMKSPRLSEAGKITTLYHSVVVDDSVSDQSQDESRRAMLEISLVPEETKFYSFQNIPEKLPALDLWPSNRSSSGDRGAMPTAVRSERVFVSKDSRTQTCSPEKPTQVMGSSSQLADDNFRGKAHSNSSQNTMSIASTEIENQSTAAELIKQKQVLQPASLSPTAKIGMRDVPMSNTRDNGTYSASVDFASQLSFTNTSQEGKLASPAASSCSIYGKNPYELARTMPVHNEMAAAVSANVDQMPQVDMLHREETAIGPRHFSDPHDKAWERNKSERTKNGKLSADFLSQPYLKEPLWSENHTSLHSARHVNGKTFPDSVSNVTEEKEIISASSGVGSQKKLVLTREEQERACSPRHSDLCENALDQRKNSLGPKKLVNKEAAANSATVEASELGTPVQKDSLKTVPSSGSPKGKRVNKTSKSAQHFVKPLIKTKNFVKRRSKKKTISDHSSKNIRSEFNNDLYSSPNPIVCPRCQCVVTETWKEEDTESSVSHQDSPISPQESPASHQESPVFYEDTPISPFASLSGEVSSGNVISDVSTPGPSSYSLDKVHPVPHDSSGNSKSRDKTEFTQSSKGSPGECSSSTSVSEESNLSRPSVCDRPHMSKDVRWEAIRHVKFQHGTLGLRHFNLLKKLGCGDIGTVYLAELIDTNCLFAIKVMDNEFLARRKKIVRAQTEKDILRMLDHPFLPTLYCQFISDNLSCLVMEYCPGGDLHVLRQRQPGRCFSEQAARFYVAEVLLALEYLHMLGVIYRDLKPENILVREDGHIMLSDFDLSLRCAVNPTLLVSSSMSDTSRKVHRPCVDSRCVQPLCIQPSCQVSCFTPRLLTSSSKLKKMKSDVAAEMRPLLQLVAEPTSARSNSFVGTHEYLAPEIIKGEGHGSAVDWWTFGIFLYELLYGRTPFKGAGNEETLANVVLQSLKFPDSPLVSLQARDLISALLVKEPENRLGTERGAAEIKQHQFFDGLNWALIRCAVPPELPEARSYGMPKTVPHDNNGAEYSSGSGSAELLEFEVF